LSIKDIAIDVLASEPFRTLLSALERTPGGKNVLNWLSRPRGVYLNFEEAWAAARRSTHAGHDHPDYIDLHVKLSGIRASDYAVLYWLTRIRPGDMSIFDFAGSIGNLYYNYAGYLDDGIRDVQWTVFDLPKTVQEGRKLATTRASSGLGFSETLDSFSREHILVVSSAFHYLETTVKQFIEQFPETPQHIIVNRTPVIEKERTFVTVQYAGTYALPCKIRNSDELISEFDAMDYEMTDRWTAPELSIRLPFFPSRTISTYAGFYFRRKSLKLDQANFAGSNSLPTSESHS
jgi:putative methyltransferase (TIGR04325 family)